MLTHTQLWTCKKRQLVSFWTAHGRHCLQCMVHALFHTAASWQKATETFSSHTSAISKHHVTALQVQQACENVCTAVASLLQPCTQKIITPTAEVQHLWCLAAKWKVAGLMPNHCKSILTGVKWENWIELSNNKVQGNTQVMRHARMERLISPIWRSLTCARSMLCKLSRTLFPTKHNHCGGKNTHILIFWRLFKDPLIFSINLQSTCAFTIAFHEPSIALAF